MRFFLSAGEPSGDLHGASLVRALRARYPRAEFLGFGGDKMAAEGCRILHPLADNPIIGFGAILGAIPMLWRVLGIARDEFRKGGIDAMIPIDYPGFHWHLAACARKHGVPVSYFVPPQIWAWATWRHRKMKRVTNQVLCTLPFEKPWLESRGIDTTYVGHPYFDEMARQRLDAGFLAAQRARPGTVVALLPGSRGSELKGNTPTLLRAAEMIHAKRPDVRFVATCLKPAQAEYVRGVFGSAKVPVEVTSGRTAEVLHLAHSSISVSGSVSLEILHHLKPSVMIYRASAFARTLRPWLQACKYITLVNLLAEKQLFPEYVYGGLGPAEKMAEHVLTWLNDRAAYESLRSELRELKDTVAVPGACDRAAAAIGELVEAKRVRAA